MPEARTTKAVGADRSPARHDGTVAPGYEAVKTAFVAGLGGFGDGGGGFSAYVHGSPVVDLWGGRTAPETAWQRDTLAVLMSATKGFVTVCAQILADRGLLDLEAPVARYWPEFSQRGKEQVLVRHVLMHTSGVIGFDVRPPLQWDGSGWGDYDGIAAGLAASAPAWEPGTKFGYHALTYGWLVGELVRRIDGRTVGRFFDEEVATPLGLDAHIGTDATDRPRVAPIVNHMMSEVPWLVRTLFKGALGRLNDPSSLAGRAFVADGSGTLFDRAEEFFNAGSALSVEIPAGNGTATARSLARLYAALAMNGELDGVRLLSSEIVATFAQQQNEARDVLLNESSPMLLRRYLSRPVRRTLGYLMNPKFAGSPPTFGPNPRAFGHDGAGGQIAFCDRDNGISVGYVRSDLSSSSRHSTKLIGALYECADAAP